MSRKKYVSLFVLFIVLLSGCEKNNADISNNTDVDVTDDQEYNLLITNNSPLFLKSVVVTVDEGNDVQINSLIDSNIKHGGVAKFPIDNGKHLFKVTLNPKDNYSVSKEFNEEFKAGEIVEYQILIEQNEVSIQKIKDIK
ncbi:hypothetical protein [Paenibacillus odorifer]|uniref:hypothetical protein n=1 Tax=Paenibacillus odorifer TaxID=189426 RepID=UPI000BA18930|nr:hypothetical protein [Paenibacillus odorifer]OZQ76486.1 hypothetical protein CA596_09640 [Paenibacillus odorifer]